MIPYKRKIDEELNKLDNNIIIKIYGGQTKTNIKRKRKSR
jgi:hypothetical protein